MAATAVFIPLSVTACLSSCGTATEQASVMVSEITTTSATGLLMANGVVK